MITTFYVELPALLNKCLKNLLKSNQREKIISALIQGTDKDQANSAERTINISGKLTKHKHDQIGSEKVRSGPFTP